MNVAVITGAKSWIAIETKKKLEANGWTVVMCDRTVMDVQDPMSVRKALSKILADHGHINAMINVAGGIRLPNSSGKELRGNFTTQAPSEFAEIIDKNFMSVVNTSREVIPYLMNTHGSIVNVVSTAAIRGIPRMSAYSAAKGAVLAFSRALAQELGSWQVRVNCVLPGVTTSQWNPHGRNPINTELSPLGRITSPVDVAGAIAYLVSDDASHTTGACVDVSGGVALH